MSHKPLHHQQLTIAQKQVYNNAGWQGNKKGNCLVGRRGVGWVSEEVPSPRLTVMAVFKCSSSNGFNLS